MNFLSSLTQSGKVRPFLLALCLGIAAPGALAVRDDVQVPGTKTWHWYSRDAVTDENLSEIFLDEQYTQNTYLTFKCWGDRGFQFGVTTKHTLLPDLDELDLNSLYRVTYRIGTALPATVYDLGRLGVDGAVRRDTLGLRDTAANEAILSGLLSGQKVILRVEPNGPDALVRQPLTLTFLPAGVPQAFKAIQSCDMGVLPG
ncbi:hypothetical protein ACFSR9_13105 [Deinococcus taklimakanensis]|uniref:Uncharacterized protein n=1 Tax=Deinococcus taklimakanensis TaxID=536443 RepID=A0ABW5P626_9DEIO